MSMDRDPNVYDRETRVYDRDTSRGSNTLAYLIGGLVIALGLLAFLFWDGSGTNEPTTTGSTATTSEPAPAAPSKPVTPAAPAAPAPATPAPANPQ